MTEPTTSTTAASTSHSCGELAAHRGVHDPTRGHLPLTVWLAAADTESAATCESGCSHPVSGPLARHLIVTCTRIGETVIHLGATDHQVVSAALTAGCLPVAVFTDANRAGVTWTRLARTHPDYDLEVTDLLITDPGDDEQLVLADLTASAGLVVVEHTCQQLLVADGRPTFDDSVEVLEVTRAAELVKPGGHLVVVTGLHRTDRVVDPLPEIIAQARDAGLVYLQHLITLRQPARGERIHADVSGRGLAASQELSECAGLPASARAHSDVLLFTRPKTPSSSSEPGTGPAEPLSGRNASATAAQNGGERS
ncbi:hypothetical protein [Nonomuraea angiospora]